MNIMQDHFAFAPTNIKIGRSKFRHSHTYKTTLDVGQLIPLGSPQEVLPGDTFKINPTVVARMTTPLYPIMDNLELSTCFFFVPNRIVWKHWKEFMGENTTSKWEQTTQYEIPQIKAPSGGWDSGSLADYFALPTKKDTTNESWSHLPFRGYCAIWNQYFRDENLQDPCFINDDETTLTGTNSGTYVTNAQLGAAPLNVCKNHDIFTSCLPQPQKHGDIPLPLGTIAPVYTQSGEWDYSKYPKGATGAYPLLFRKTADGTKPNDQQIGTFASEGRLGTSTTAAGTNSTLLYPANLYTDLSVATSATINELRLAFQLQKFYERDSRGGTKYQEMCLAHFGVQGSDARVQVPEFLGGQTTPINIEQVIQTSRSETGETPQGTAAAYSLTATNQNGFVKSFTEHGYLFALCYIKQHKHSYQNMVEKHWSRKKRTDFYFPVFANLGEMPISMRQINYTDTSADSDAFGYQEAWAEYRYLPDTVTGMFRSNVTGTLDSWHLADNYATSPTLGSDWIQESKSNLQRCLAVQDEPQFIIDVYFDEVAVRPMPLYSIPGLLDHN